MPVQTILDGEKNVIVKITGTGTQLAVDVSALVPPCPEVRITKIWYDSDGVAPVSIDWVATADLSAWVCAANTAETMCFDCFGGLVNNAGAGKNGDVEINGGGAVYSIVLYCEKVRPNIPL